MAKKRSRAPVDSQQGSRKEKARSLINDSPWVKVQREIVQHADLRKHLIHQVASQFPEYMVITYFTSFRGGESQIGDEDAEILESLLAAEHDGGGILLILNSPGGQALAAERIVNVCRAYAGDRFEVLVPHMAKSAATMICFGASIIHMAKTAELGPVDPQVPYKRDDGGLVWISADEYVRSYDDLMKAAFEGVNKRIEPYLQQLGRYDARFIEQLRSSQKLSEDISIRLLQSSMMKQQPADKIKQAISIFLTQSGKSAHGRMIGFEEAEGCGLKLRLIDLRSELWNTLWELYIRSDHVAGRKGKIMETKASNVATT